MADQIKNRVPAEVRAAVERMCTPLDKSWLKGATAEADAQCMATIKKFIESLDAAPAVPAVDALTVEPTGYQVREIGEGDNWRDVSKETYDRYSMSPMWDTRMIIDTSTAPVAQTSDALQLRCEQDKFSAWSVNNLPKQSQPSCNAVLRAAPASQNDTNFTFLRIAVDSLQHDIGTYLRTGDRSVLVLAREVGRVTLDSIKDDPRLPVEGGNTNDNTSSNLAHPADAGAVAVEQPIPMILHCPKCGLQHIDAPETHEVLTESGLAEVPNWTNPPHRSHLCHGCSHIWRPADVPTEGVRVIETRGKGDSPAPADAVSVEQAMRAIFAKYDLENIADRLIVDLASLSIANNHQATPLAATSEQDDELPISMSTYGSLAACEAERARRGEQMGGAQVAKAEHEFKNFHRMLCERFGYPHDERDWKRDQVSLMEYLAKSRAAEGEATSEQADPKVSYVRELVQSGEFMKLVAKWSTCSILEKDAAWAEVLRYTREVTHRQHVRSYNAGLAAATSERKPLTAAEIWQIAPRHSTAADGIDPITFARAIEQHHGITGGGK